MAFEPPLELFSLERKAALLPGGLLLCSPNLDLGASFVLVICYAAHFCEQDNLAAEGPFLASASISYAFFSHRFTSSSFSGFAFFATWSPPRRPYLP